MAQKLLFFSHKWLRRSSTIFQVLWLWHIYGPENLYDLFRSQFCHIFLSAEVWPEALSLTKTNKVQLQVSQILFNIFLSLLISVSAQDLLFSSNENVSNYLCNSQTVLLDPDLVLIKWFLTCIMLLTTYNYAISSRNNSPGEMSSVTSISCSVLLNANMLFAVLW